MGRYFRRTLPPAAAPVRASALASGIQGLLQSDRSMACLRESLCAYFNVRHCFFFSSGKAALAVLLKALHDLSPGRTDVLIPAYTCYSVPSAVAKAGLRIRLADMAEGTLDFDMKALANIDTGDKPAPADAGSSAVAMEIRTEKMLAVLPTHLYGLPADVARVRELITDPDVIVVEDAAQAMGARRNGRLLGTSGDVGFFSLGRGKAFSTVAGGVLITNRRDIAGAVEGLIAQMAAFGTMGTLRLVCEAVCLFFMLSPHIFWFPKAMPFLKLGETHYDPDFDIRRFTAFQVGLAEAWQHQLESLQRQRKRVAQRWYHAIEEGCVDKCTQLADPSALSYLTRYPLLIDDPGNRAKILQMSEKQGLGIMPGYPGAINEIDALVETFKHGRYPNAMQLARRIITLPVHPYVGSEDIRRSVGLINGIVED